MYPTNRSAWNQVDPNLNAINKTNRQEDMGQLFTEQGKSAAKNKGKSSDSSSQNFPPMPPLDFSVLKASQIAITPPLVNPLFKPVVKQTVNQTQTNTTTVTTTTMSSTSSTNSARSKAKKHRRAASDKTSSHAKDDVSKLSASSASRQRTQSVRGMKYLANSSTTKSPEEKKREKMSSSSQSSSTTTTPNEGENSGNTTPPVSPRGANMNNLRMKFSKKFSTIDLSKITTSVKEALSPNVSPRKTTIEKEKDEPLSSVSFAERNENAKKLLTLQLTEEFQRHTLLHKTALMHAVVSENLPNDSQLANIAGLNLLVEDANIRNRNFKVNTVINLEGAAHCEWVKQISEMHLEGSWTKDSSDASGAFKSIGEAEKAALQSAFKPTFLADSARGVIYNQTLADGSIKPFNSILVLADYLNEGRKDTERSMLISNVTSQNLATFLTRTIFEHLPPDLPRTPLRLYNGTAIIPRGKSQQEYTFSKATNGDIIVKAKLHLRPSKSSDNEVLRYSQTAEGRSQVQVMESAWLTIETELHFHPEGDWHMSNLVLKAEGWNMPQDF